MSFWKPASLVQLFPLSGCNQWLAQNFLSHESYLRKLFSQVIFMKFILSRESRQVYPRLKNRFYFNSKNWEKTYFFKCYKQCKKWSNYTCIGGVPLISGIAQCEITLHTFLPIRRFCNCDSSDLISKPLVFTLGIVAVDGSIEVMEATDSGGIGNHPPQILSEPLPLWCSSYQCCCCCCFFCLFVCLFVFFNLFILVPMWSLDSSPLNFVTPKWTNIPSLTMTS